MSLCLERGFLPHMWRQSLAQGHSPQANCHCLAINYCSDSAESNSWDDSENNMRYARCAQEDISHSRYFKLERFNVRNELLIKFGGKLGQPRSKVCSSSWFCGNKEMH